MTLFSLAYSRQPGLAGWTYVRHLSFEEVLSLPNRLAQGFQICENALPAIHAEMSEAK